jgi:hypothetical protein
VTEQHVEEIPIAWTAIGQHVEVFASDGAKVGVVDEVLGTGPTGIFHGIVVKREGSHGHVTVLGQDVDVITNKRITLKIDGATFDKLPPYVEEESFRIGLSGLFRKRPNWKREGDS